MPENKISTELQSRILNYTLLSVLFFYCSLFFAKFIILCSDGVLNSYPFVTPDGFDWYTEGFYLSKLLRGAGEKVVLPVLRPPMYVIVCAIDNLFGAKGYILGLVSSACVFFQPILATVLIGRLNNSKDFSAIVFLCAIFSLVFFPINYVGIYLLADLLAVTLSLVACISIVCDSKRSTTLSFVVSLLLSIMAALTQTYTLIPIFGFALIYFLYKNDRTNVARLVWVGSLIFFSVLFTLIWRYVLPHGMTPNNFNLLEFGTGMTSFYANNWTYYLAPMVFLCLPFYIFRLNQFKIDLSALMVLSIVLVMMLFAYSYQWPESRFTYTFWIYFVVLALLPVGFCSFKNNLISISSVPFFVLSSLIFISSGTSNHWNVNLRTVEFFSRNAWVIQFMSATPVHRDITPCVNSCADNAFYINSDGYVKSVIDVYNRIYSIN